MLTRLAAAALAAAAATGCGSSDSPVARRHVVPPTLTPDPPAEYALDDPACLKGSVKELAVTKTTILAWDGPQVVSKDVTFHDLVSKDSLTSPAINGTTARDIYERTCDANQPANHQCDDEKGDEKPWDLVGSSGKLRICQDNHAYNPLSYEGVALTGLYFLQKARDRYQQLAVADGAKAPAPIQLAVMPHFIDDYDNYLQDGETKRLRLYVTHNLAYFAYGQIMAIFPEAADEAPQPGYFWQSEFVLSHEYGHHIDFTRHGHKLADMGLRWNPLAHSFVDERALAQGLDGSTDQAQIAGALAEAFADMMAFYSEGGTARSLIGVPNIGYDRNVSNASFGNGDKKVLTPERLNVLFGLADQGLPPQGAPNYADIHIVGAIFAHAADEALAKLAATNPNLVPGSDEDINLRYRLALTYMDHVVSETASLALDDGGTKVLSPVGKALAATAESYFASFPLTDSPGGAAATKEDEVKAEVCRIVRDELPAMEDVPFAKGTDC